MTSMMEDGGQPTDSPRTAHEQFTAHARVVIRQGFWGILGDSGGFGGILTDSQGFGGTFA